MIILFYFEIDGNKFNLFPDFNINSNLSNITDNYTNNTNYDDLFKNQYYQPFDELYSENRINIKPKDGEK